jgi:tetratricopeptide (TPR) repeat protein
MKEISLLLLISFTFTAPLQACLNEYRISAGGKVTVADEYAYLPSGHIGPESFAFYEDALKELDSLWHATHNVDHYSDYGVYLVYLGRYEEAKNVFIEIEKLHPGKYATAANLGTVFELLGENEKALQWIRKAVAIDPASHNHSEWIHVKILEGKVSDEKLTSMFLLNTTFGEDSIPQSTLTETELKKLRDGLFYQLEERMSFIREPDPIVALLLFELGNIVAITDDLNSAMAIYERAEAYGFESQILTKRAAKFQQMIDAFSQIDERQNNFIPVAKYAAAFVLIAAGVAVILFRRK